MGMIHAKHCVEGAFHASNRFKAEPTARCHDHLLVVEHILRSAHIKYRQTYDVNQEQLYEAALDRILSELTVTTFETDAGYEAYMIFLLGTVVVKQQISGTCVGDFRLVSRSHRRRPIILCMKLLAYHFTARTRGRRAW